MSVVGEFSFKNQFSPLSKEEITAVRDKWSEGKPYVFFVGSMHPRKNIKRLIDGFNLFKERTQSDFKLVLAGSLLWQKTDIEDSYTNSQYKDDIIFTGRLSDDDLQKVLGAAYALSFVPIFEGFGLPISVQQAGQPWLHYQYSEQVAEERSGNPVFHSIH